MRTLNKLTYRQINADIQRLDLEELMEENALLPHTLTGQTERMLKVYVTIRSLLVAISTLPLFSPSWRAALSLFVQLCDAMAGSGSGEKGFKAGRDL
jgi:hypothetical protein